MSQFNSLIDRMKTDVAAEVAEWDALDAARIQEQIKKRGGKRETIEGFYVDAGDGCGPMQLMKNETHIQPWLTSTLYHNYGKMTIFIHRERAQEAIEQSRKKGEKYNHLSQNHEIYPTGENNVWNFLDDNSRVYIPASDLIEICDELPSKKPLLRRLFKR